MSGKTSIQWTDKTWNPLTGCTRVSSGCQKCYAFELHDMRHRVYQRDGGVYPNGKPMPAQYAKPFSEIQLLPSRLEDPLHIKTPSMFFVNSMSDFFHSDVPDEYIFQMVETMRKADWHIFQVLTKRVGRLRRLGKRIDWPANVWMGVSIELDNLTPRADALREVDAAVRFLSCEPLLGPLPSLNLEGIHWVIAGAESGDPDSRPMNEDWARELRDKCIASDARFFYKQNAVKGRKISTPALDGKVWKEFPEMPIAQPIEKAVSGLWG
jgi:protein gp37